MDTSEEIYITSRSRTPSLIDVTSQSEKVFTNLPDLIQEAVVSSEFSSPRLNISRVQHRAVDNEYMTQPMFYIRPRTDSGVDLPELNVTDEKVLGKYGLDLTANFSEIRAYGAKAFFEKPNASTGTKYSLCACATGYIWVAITHLDHASDPWNWDEAEIQIGTYALKAKAITTVEIICKYNYVHQTGRTEPGDRQLSLLCSTVLGKYLRNRMIGQQYEEATETAIRHTRNELSPLRIVDPGRFENLDSVLRQVCTNAPMPPISDVSLISRSMITTRWQCWRETSILRRRCAFPKRVIHCFRSRHDPIDLLSGCYMALKQEKAHRTTIATVQTG